MFMWVGVCSPPCVHGACIGNSTCHCSEGYHGLTCETEGSSLPTSHSFLCIVSAMFSFWEVWKQHLWKWSYLQSSCWRLHMWMPPWVYRNFLWKWKYEYIICFKYILYLKWYIFISVEGTSATEFSTSSLLVSSLAGAVVGVLVVIIGSAIIATVVIILFMKRKKMKLHKVEEIELKKESEVIENVYKEWQFYTFVTINTCIIVSAS